MSHNRKITPPLRTVLRPVILGLMICASCALNACASAPERSEGSVSNSDDTARMAKVVRAFERLEPPAVRKLAY